ncbi:MAG: hypothetical protein ACI9G1_002149, partial [Pirellulaceae bacterium]
MNSFSNTFFVRSMLCAFATFLAISFATIDSSYGASDSEAALDGLEGDSGEAASAARWAELVKEAQLRRARDAGLISTLSNESKPVSGDVVGLMILVQFPDDPTTGEIDPVNFPTDVAKIDRFCNQIKYVEDGNLGSIRDYFRYQSLGKLDLTHIVSPIITLPHPKNYYHFADYPINRVLREGVNEQAIVKDAIRVLKAQDFDFSGLSTIGNTIRDIS